MIAGRIAPAKPSHLINVVEFQRNASEEGNRHECSDVASEEGSRGSKLGMIAGRGAPAKPSEASELPRPPEAPQGPDGPHGAADEESRNGAEEGGVKVHQWTKVAKSDNSPAQSFTADADASGGWKAQETYHGQEPTDGFGACAAEAEALAREISRLQGLAEFMEAQGEGEAAKSFRAQLKDAKDKRAAAKPFPHQLRDAQIKVKSPKSKNRPKNNPSG